jgi:hypothetical protein
MPARKDATPEVVAKWMLGEVEQDGVLAQAVAVDEIAHRFGDEFVYENERGALAIDKRVLSAFLDVSRETVVWQRRGRFWRKREPGDGPGRQQGW